MVINHNLSAMNTQRQLNITGTQRTKSAEKLSSGYKINRSADDAAGLTISEKMRSQIRGLDQGARNVQDGISLLQVADGALAEVHDMLHRMNELAIQAANDTNNIEDRQAIQAEINELLEEIDRVSYTTEFNKFPVFNVGHSNVRKPQEYKELDPWDLSDEEIRKQLFNATYPHVKGDVILDDIGGVLPKEKAEDFLSALSEWIYWDEVHKYTFPQDVEELKTIFYDALYKEKGITEDEARWGVYAKIKEGFENKDKSCFYKDHAPDYEQTWKQFDGKLSQLCLWIGNHTQTFSVRGLISDLKDFSERTSGELSDLCGRMDYDHYSGDINDARKQAYDIYRYIFRHESEEKKETNDKYEYKKNEIWIQSGANVGDGMNITTGDINTRILGINNLNVLSHRNAEKTMDAVSNAVGKVSELRSHIGAQQNRLEHTYANVTNMSENAQAAESRIRDTDMAKEMVTQSKLNILGQVGTMMLTQSNQSPQGVLKLLQ